VKPPFPCLALFLLSAFSPSKAVPQQPNDRPADSRTVTNPYFAKAVQLAETNNIQQLRGAYDADTEDWTSTLKVPPFTNCVIDKDAEEGSTIYTLRCIKRVGSDEEQAALADSIEAGVAAHPGITKTTARDRANRHSQFFHSNGGALIAVRRDRSLHLVVLSLQPPVKD
jgi:hypothetical protein